MHLGGKKSSVCVNLLKKTKLDEPEIQSCECKEHTERSMFSWFNFAPLKKKVFSALSSKSI